MTDQSDFICKAIDAYRIRIRVDATREILTVTVDRKCPGQNDELLGTLSVGVPASESEVQDLIDFVSEKAPGYSGGANALIEDAHQTALDRWGIPLLVE